MARLPWQTPAARAASIFNPPTHQCAPSPLYLDNAPRPWTKKDLSQLDLSRPPPPSPRSSVHGAPSTISAKDGDLLHEEFPWAPSPPEPCILFKFHVSSVQRCKCSWWGHGWTRAGEVAGIYIVYPERHVYIPITHTYINEGISIHGRYKSVFTALTSHCAFARFLQRQIANAGHECRANNEWPAHHRGRGSTSSRWTPQNPVAMDPGQPAARVLSTPPWGPLVAAQSPSMAPSLIDAVSRPPSQGGKKVGSRNLQGGIVPASGVGF